MRNKSQYVGVSRGASQQPKITKDANIGRISKNIHRNNARHSNHHLHIISINSDNVNIDRPLFTAINN